MNRLAQFGFGAAFALVLAAGAQAQPTPVTTDQGTATKPVSHHDARKIKACQAMDHGAMMNDSGCRRMMKQHPDMMDTDPTAEGH